MGVVICDECIKEYFPEQPMTEGSWAQKYRCSSCGCKDTTIRRIYYGLHLDDFKNMYFSRFKLKVRLNE